MYDQQICDGIERKMKESKILLYGCWALCIGFIYLRTAYDVSPPTSLIPGQYHSQYDAVQRELWACSICWIVFACHKLKSGGIIRRFLSHPSWQPLSKLTLSMYLFHPVYFLFTNGYYTGNFNFQWIMHLHFGDIVFSIIAATFAFVLIEAPVARLTEIMWKSEEQLKNNYEVLKEKKQNVV